MRKDQIFYLLVACFLLSCSITLAQQEKKPLTNADVMTMLKAQLPESTIVLAIQQSPANYDVSPQALIELKNQGASSKILDAILQAQSGKSSDSSTIGNTNVMADGVILVLGSDRLKMKQSETDFRVSTGGVNPFGKTKSKDALNGKQAQLRITNTSPMFELYLPNDVYPADHVMLVKLIVKSDRREIQTLEVGAFTDAKSGYRKKDILPTTIEELQTQTVAGAYKLHRVKVISPLPSGEYALVVDNVYYAFGVDSIK